MKIEIEQEENNGKVLFDVIYFCTSCVMLEKKEEEKKYTHARYIKRIRTITRIRKVLPLFIANK